MPFIVLSSRSGSDLWVNADQVTGLTARPKGGTRLRLKTGQYVDFPAPLERVRAALENSRLPSRFGSP